MYDAVTDRPHLTLEMAADRMAPREVCSQEIK
jgi:hypothetical protein